jgi:hypothetical protein
MPSFEDMFMKTAGKPIEYQGKTLVMFDDFPTEGARRLRLVFEECTSEWRQGVALRFQGKVKVNGQIIRRGFMLWHDTAPRTVELELIGKIASIQVKNIWDVGNGVIESWHNGAAMIVEILPEGRRYRCNDGFADDDFNDVVFCIERVAEGRVAEP